MFDAHAREVFAFLVRRCESASAAEDLLSLVFLEAWRCHARAHVVDDSLRPWLFGIATNVARNARRAARRHAAALDRYHASNPETASPDCADDAVRHADEQRDGAALRDALGRLPRRERAVVDLCLVADLSVDAASAVLGIPVGTVRSRRPTFTQTSEVPHQPAPTGHEQGERHNGACIGVMGSGEHT
jgi:RNA polymerase sigma-70 factor (ECF subfamily)